jgi:hypothetical protein
MWTPETHTLFGAYEGPTGPAPGWPAWLEHNPYTRTDWGGDSGLGEIAVMALDYYHYTGSAEYVWPSLFANTPQSTCGHHCLQINKHSEARECKLCYFFSAPQL